jgi:hypothetical protein
MIRYLENIIVYSIDLDLKDNPCELTFILPSAKGAEADNEFYSRLSIDSYTVACKNKSIY